MIAPDVFGGIKTFRPKNELDPHDLALTKGSKFSAVQAKLIALRMFNYAFRDTALSQAVVNLSVMSKTESHATLNLTCNWGVNRHLVEIFPFGCGSIMDLSLERHDTLDLEARNYWTLKASTFHAFTPLKDHFEGQNAYLHYQELTESITIPSLEEYHSTNPYETSILRSAGIGDRVKNWLVKVDLAKMKKRIAYKCEAMELLTRHNLKVQDVLPNHDLEISIYNLIFGSEPITEINDQITLSSGNTLEIIDRISFARIECLLNAYGNPLELPRALNPRVRKKIPFPPSDCQFNSISDFVMECGKVTYANLIDQSALFLNEQLSLA